jgi:photosystem II stability/assembly factor-like uncharacterized protein
LKTEREPIWQQLPALTLPSPVLALAGRGDDLWAGGVGGVARYPTSEARETWESAAAKLPLSSVTALLALDGFLLAGGSEGIACSYTGGATWQQAKLEDGVVAVTAFAASPNFASDQTAIAATLANGIVRTTDGGYTWMNASFGLESMEVTTLVWGADGSILAATEDGIYRSRDAGRAWRRDYADEELEIEAFIALADGTILAVLADGGMLSSHDDGKHWATDGLRSQHAQVISSAVTSTGTLLLGTIGRGLLRSSDGGTSWQPVYERIVYTCALIDGRIYVGTDTGVSFSVDDGLTWSELPCPPVHDLRALLVREDCLLLAGTHSGIVRATPAAGWERLERVPQPLTAFAFAPDDALFLSSPAGLMRLPLEGGTPQVLVEGQAGQVAHITMCSSGGSWHIWAASADGSRLLHSADGGASWRPLRTPFGILPLIALQAVSDRLCAATYDPRQYQVCLWYSIDDGETWVRSLEAGTDWPVVAACAHPAALSLGNKLFLEQAPGQWRLVTVGSDGSGIRRVLGIQSGEKIMLCVLTTSGIQRSEDMGETWQQEHINLPGDHIIDIAATGTTLYALLSGGRLWKRDLREPSLSTI